MSMRPTKSPRPSPTTTNWRFSGARRTKNVTTRLGPSNDAVTAVVDPRGAPSPRVLPARIPVTAVAVIKGTRYKTQADDRSSSGRWAMLSAMKNVASPVNASVPSANAATFQSASVSGDSPRGSMADSRSLGMDERPC